MIHVVEPRLHMGHNHGLYNHQNITSTFFPNPTQIMIFHHFQHWLVNHISLKQFIKRLTLTVKLNQFKVIWIKLKVMFAWFHLAFVVKVLGCLSLWLKLEIVPPPLIYIPWFCHPSSRKLFFNVQDNWPIYVSYNIDNAAELWSIGSVTRFKIRKS